MRKVLFTLSAGLNINQATPVGERSAFFSTFPSGALEFQRADRPYRNDMERRGGEGGGARETSSG